MKDEYLFYGGIILSGLIFVTIIVYILLMKIKWSKIKAELIKEYGQNIITKEQK